MQTLMQQDPVLSSIEIIPNSLNNFVREKAPNFSHKHYRIPEICGRDH